MSFSISRAQQKIFIEHFMSQVLDLSLQLVDDGKERGSPGETVFAVAEALIKQIYQMQAPAERGGRRAPADAMGHDRAPLVMDGGDGGVEDSDDDADGNRRDDGRGTDD
jgi:hypothetical protein